MKNATQRFVWAVYFVGYDDAIDENAESHIDPYVGKERVATSSDPQKAAYDVNLAVMARGGELLAITIDDEAHAESVRLAGESQILRKR